MTEYDIDGFQQWMQKRYTEAVVWLRVEVIKIANERKIPWNTLRNYSAAELYEIIRGRPAGSRTHAGNHRSAITSYEQYLDQKERGVA